MKTKHPAKQIASEGLWLLHLEVGMINASCRGEGGGEGKRPKVQRHMPACSLFWWLKLRKLGCSLLKWAHE